MDCPMKAMSSHSLAELAWRSTYCSASSLTRFTSMTLMRQSTHFGERFLTTPKSSAHSCKQCRSRRESGADRRKYSLQVSNHQTHLTSGLRCFISIERIDQAFSMVE